MLAAEEVGEEGAEGGDGDVGDEGGGGDGLAEGAMALDPTLPAHSMEKEKEINKEKRTPPPGARLSGTHLPLSRPALAHISSLHPNAYFHLLPFRWKEDPAVKSREIVWREDMDAFVLGLLRGRVVRELRGVGGGGGYVAPLEGWGGLRGGRGVGGVLWLGEGVAREVDASGEAGKGASGEVEEELPGAGEKGPEEEPLEMDNATEKWQHSKKGPPAYTLARCGKRLRPVFNLRRLLGEEHLAGLRALSPRIWGGEVLVLKGKRRTAGVLMDLWMLEGYLALG